MVAIYRHVFPLFAAAVIFLASQTTAISALLVLDNSGSMKRNDPDGLRFTALELVSALLDENDEMGVVLFSTTSTPLTDGLISPRDFSGLQPLDASGYTDMKAAMLDAQAMFGNARPENRQGMILLSDGKPEIPNPYPEYEQETLLLAEQLGVPIYAIALSEQADTDFLRQLALVTGGQVILAKEAGDLLDAYLIAFGAIQDRTILGTGNENFPGQAKIFIDESLAPYLEKISFVLTKPENVSARLLSPDGRAVVPGFLSARVVENERFLVVTVFRPAGGEWTFELEGRGSVQARAILYSRLRTYVNQPAGIHKAGEPMPIVLNMLEEQVNGDTSRIIGNVEFSAQIRLPDGSLVSLDRFYDDGTHGDRIAGDGDYTRLLLDTHQPGQYRIEVKGWKGSVAVEQVAWFEVLPFPELQAILPTEPFYVGSRPLEIKANFLDGQLSGLHGGQIIARINAPSGKIHEIELSGAQGAYTGQFWPEESGVYTILLETHHMTYFGAPLWSADRVQFETVISRAVVFSPVDVAVASSCREGVTGIVLKFTVSSLREEELSIKLNGLPAFSPGAFSVQLAVGDQDIDVRVLPFGENPKPGVYSAWLVPDENPDILMSPATIPVEIIIPSVWQRCDGEIRFWGTGLILLTMAGAVITIRVRQKSKPPLISGTLRVWQDDNKPQDYDLTALSKNQLVIGRQPGCDLPFPNSELAGKHFALQAEQGDTGTLVVLLPTELIKKRYVLVESQFVLEHKNEFSAGGLNFLYLSDSGE